LKGEDVEILCLRYLIGLGGVDKGFEQMKKMLVWRKENKTWEIPDSLYHERRFIHAEKLFKYKGGALSIPFTKKGRPITIAFLGRLKVDELVKNVTIDEYKQHMREMFVTDVSRTGVLGI